MTFDLGYSLDWPTPRPVSHYIIQKELKWFGYHDYETDLLDMLDA